MKIRWFKHVPFEGLGHIEHWAKDRCYDVHPTRLYQRDPWPDTDDLDWLIVMGGPMNVYQEDRYTWLKGEKKFIEKAIAAGKTVIGICLGAQLIADVLGSRVYALHHKEIGWFPVLKAREAAKSAVFQNFPPEINAFHWHGDTFDLPSGSVRFAESAACQNQAFCFEDRIFGLQFHLEITKQGAEGLISNCGDEIVEGPFIQSAKRILSRERNFIKANEQMSQLLDAFARVSD